MRIFWIVFLLNFFFAATAFSQTEVAADGQQQDEDTAAAQAAVIDSALKFGYVNTTGGKSLLLDEKKIVVNDIEQYNAPRRNATVLVLLIIMLAALTYLKTAFNKDLEDLLQSVVNRNISQQIFRTQSKEISFSSIVLNFNFTIAISLYARFVLIKYFHVSSLENFSAILIFIFLFTFFYLAKIIVVKFIGEMFDARDVCDEYIFNFTIICKSLGLALLPALFIFYTAPERFFDFIFIATVFISAMLLLIFIWRGLSTGYKLMYTSVYHFFIYVCVVEVSPIFLLFKLLTKTIT